MKIDGHDLIIRIEHCSEAGLVKLLRDAVILSIQALALRVDDYNNGYENAIYWQTQILKAVSPDEDALEIILNDKKK